MKLLKVTWIDASDPDRQTSWFEEEEVNQFAEEDVEVLSVGWEFKRTKKYLTLVSDEITKGVSAKTYGRLTKIPIAWIQEETIVS